MGEFNCQQNVTPANPSGGFNKLYFKADGNLYMLDSAGVETQVNAGATTLNYTLVTDSGSQVLVGGLLDNFLNWDTVVLDPLGMWNIADVTKLTVPAGYTKAEVIMSTTIANNTAGSINTALVFVNGAANFGGLNGVTNGTSNAGANNSIQVASPLIPVVAGDFIQVSIRTSDVTPASAFDLFGFFQVKLYV